MDAAWIYEDTRARLHGLLKGLSDADAATATAACPAWSVHDVLRHVVAVPEDFASGNMEGAPGAEWSARQIAQRADRSVSDLLSDWNSGPASSLLAGAGAGAAPILAMDVTQHEHDIRAAIGQPGGRDSAGVDLCVQAGMQQLDGRLKAKNLAALRVVSGNEEWEVGNGAPAATLTIDRFDLCRALFGRRSREQVSGGRWEGDPTPYLDAYFLFGPAAEPIIE